MFSLIEIYKNWERSLYEAEEQTIHLVKKEDVLEALREYPMAQEKVTHLPNIESRQKGKWKTEPNRVWVECSACGKGASFITKYCPNCGAEMGSE